MKRSRECGRRPSAAIILAIAVAMASAAVLGSCASAPYMPREEKVQKLALLIDRGGVGSVAGLARSPFILDGEILLRQADVDAAWANFASSKLGMKKPKVVSVSRIAPDSYKSFADTMDARVFFKKYLDEDSVLAVVDSSGGRYCLVLNREVSGYPRIQGIKGPVK
jgi:hypothetical protein